jgi:hypothetical protein
LTSAAIAAEIGHDQLLAVTEASAPRDVGDAPPIQGDSVIGWVSRFVGLWFVAGGLVALVIDATKTIAASALTVTPFGGSISAALGPAALMSVQEFVQQRIETYVGNWLWDPVIQWFLLLPTWAMLGAAGFLLTYLGRRRRLSLTYA